MVEEQTTNLPVEEEEGIEFGSDKVAENSDEFEVIEEGFYEVVLEKLEPKKSTKNGKTTNYLNVTFKIRDDVDQQFKKRKVWYTIFQREADGIAYNFNAINPIIITQEKRSDYKNHFKTTDEILQYLIGLHLRLKIGVEFNLFKGKDDNVIVDGSFEPSVWDTEDHTVQGKNLDSIEIEDSDLPF